MSEDYEVEQGDCLNSIAFDHGFFWETLWNNSNNERLKSTRKSPQILKPGDVVHIPDLRVKQEPGATEQRHLFKRKGVPARFRLRLLRDDQPIASQPFHFDAEGHTHDGSTDGDGQIDVPLPPNAKKGLLLVGQGEDQQRLELNFGHIDPIDTNSGVAGRLSNLGYGGNADLSETIRAFQAKQGLNSTGQADESTRQKLHELFGE